MNQTKYRLLKDLPGLKAGAIREVDGWMSILGQLIFSDWFDSSAAQDWFEPIPENQPEECKCPDIMTIAASCPIHGIKPIPTTQINDKTSPVEPDLQEMYQTGDDGKTPPVEISPIKKLIYLGEDKQIEVINKKLDELIDGFNQLNANTKAINQKGE